MVYEKGKNYCTFSPDGFLKWNWSYECYLHDRQYRNEVKNRKTRLEADIDLKNGMSRKLPWFMQWLPYVYFYVTRKIGNRVWDK